MRKEKKTRTLYESDLWMFVELFHDVGIEYPRHPDGSTNIELLEEIALEYFIPKNSIYHEQWEKHVWKRVVEYATRKELRELERDIKKHLKKT